jgi:hypothetical protein
MIAVLYTDDPILTESRSRTNAGEPQIAGSRTCPAADGYREIAS